MMRDFAADELPALLQYGDAVSMAHGIEARTPFMDYRLVDWVFRNQPPVVRDGMTKWPVRAYLEAKGFAEIALRKDKKGYDVPISEWVKRQAPRIEEELFGDRNSQIWSYLNIKAVRTLFDSSLKNHSAQQTFHLHKILTLDIWLKNLKSSRSVTTIRKTHAKQLGGQEVHNES
jgi:asparagine synthase (glutamine-hydrolysing)